MITQEVMIHDFAAHVIQLCDYVTGANTLVDMQALHDKAEAVRREAVGVSHVFYP